MRPHLLLGPMDVRVHNIGHAKPRPPLARVYVFDLEGVRHTTDLRHELPAHLRTRDYRIRIHRRTVKADGIEIPLGVIVVRSVA